MKLSCSAYQAGSSYAQKILSGQTQNYGATSSTNTNPTGDSSHGITMPTWTVEEIEGKLSPNETEFGAEGTSYQQGGQICGGGTSRATTETTTAGGGRGESSRRTSSSLSHHSDVHPDQKGNQSDSTSISKAHATSSCSPSDSPAHRLSEHGRDRSKSVGEQQWTNLRAVMAWYARLRRIKRSKSNQRWMKLRTTVQLSGAIQTIQQKKAPLKREDSFLKRFSTRQIPEAQETFEIGDEEPGGGGGEWSKKGRKKRRSLPRSVVNPDGSFFFYWLMLLTFCVLYNLWTLIVRQSFPELQSGARLFWILADAFCDLVFLLDIAVQFRTGYLEQGLMVWQTKKLANHYIGAKPFYLDLFSLVPTDLFQLYFGINPMFRFPRFLKIYRIYKYYYMVESRTVYPNVWRVVNLIHILLLLAHWFGCFYYLISEAEGFQGYWGYPDATLKENEAFATLTRKYLASLYWSTLTLTTIGDLPPPHSNWQYIFTIVSYLIGVFIFATIVGQVGNVITNRNANRLEFERLLDGAKTYMRHHKVPRDMQRRVLRWYDYSWSRGRIQGGGDINTALGLLPDKLKTELALHVNLSVLKKVTIFQECQPEFLHDLVLKMKAYIFTPGDLICRKGEVAREMFIIADGILEVISETGKVLTTMQAGDFFGEIGILNLDGLNKRTADVRSVGYSELFSLSREDVLAAMKDYPEAQEILQTLGRKRLMEARKASGPAVKKTSTSGVGVAGVEIIKKVSPIDVVGLTQSASSYSNKEMSEVVPLPGAVPVDTTAGKRIVEKLRSDVKGLRNAIRRSRKSNSSKDDSSEPESGKPEESSGPKKEKKRKESTASVRDGKSFPTPRGVLKRMHNVVLSDEKDKEPSTSPSTSSPSPMIKNLFSSTVASMKTKRVQLPKVPPAQVPPTPAPIPIELEIIGAGLPLIQRLRLLRQKEERERKQLEEREAMMKTLIPTNLSFASPAVSPILQTKASIETPTVKKTTDPATALANVVERTRVERASISSNDSGSTISSPPSTSMPKSTLLIGEAAAAAASKVTTEPIPIVMGSSFPPVWTASPPRGGPGPSTKAQEAESEAASSTPTVERRPSALHFRQQHGAKNYGSVDDLSPEFSRLPFIKKLKILNERQKIAELLISKSTNSVLTRSTSEGSNENPSVPVDLLMETQMHSVQLGRRTQSHREQLQVDGDEDDSSISQFISQQQQSESNTSQQPQPEILDDKNNSSLLSSQDSNATVCLRENNSSSSSAQPNSSKSKMRKRRKIKKTSDDDGNEGSTEDSSPSPPLSPDGESNETPERRNLKSILKKLAESGGGGGGGGGGSSGGDQPQPLLDEKKLLQSSTVEGYAARHPSDQHQTAGQPNPNLPLDVTHQGGKRQGAEEIGVSSLTNVLSSYLPLTRPFSPENMKTLSRLLMVKGEEMMIEGGPEHTQPVHYQGLNIAQEECIGSVVLGIKTIIQSKLDEIQCTFQNRFDSLEHEVRRRDEIISVLQTRIQHLETRTDGDNQTSSLHRSNGQSNHIDDCAGNEGDIDIDEDLDDESDVEYQRTSSNRLPLQLQSSYLFSRGDSIDTVISAQDFDDEVFERLDVDNNLDTRQSPGNGRGQSQPRQHEGGRDRDRDNYVSSWAQGQETIEMRDLSPAPWQLEFHRDRDSLPPPNGTKDTVTLDIGNTSTEYESTSSDDEVGGSNDTIVGSVQLKEQKLSLEDDDEEDSEQSDTDKSDMDDSDNLDHKNWEIRLLAKEMEKREEKQKTTEDVVGEMRELENEIEEMKDVVNTGSLSPSELDMLESILQSKSKRMKALYKALSVESGSGSTSSPSGSPKSKVGRSYDDFRRGSGGSIAHLQQGIIDPTTALNLAQLHPRSSLRLEALARSSPYHMTERGNKLSPGEKTDLQKLIFSRKGGGVKRQASMYETTESNSSSYSREKRRESAGAIPAPNMGITSRKSSFFSRFSLLRQFTSVGRHGSHESGQETSSFLEQQEMLSPPSSTTTTSQVQVQEASTTNLSRQASSSVGILPVITATTTSVQATCSSVKSDPGGTMDSSLCDSTVIAGSTKTIVVVNATTTTCTSVTSTDSKVFTIPAVIPSAGTSTTTTSEHSFPGESQPLLLKK